MKEYPRRTLCTDLEINQARLVAEEGLGDRSPGKRDLIDLFEYLREKIRLL